MSTSNFGFLRKLHDVTDCTNSVICMGLDPVVKALPKELRVGGIHGAANYFEILLDKMEKEKVLPAAFKPNEGFYSCFDDRFGLIGSDLLTDLTNPKCGNSLVRQNLPVIIDAKRGDIGKSSANYAKQYLENMGYDAITVSPYMGFDSVKPFIAYCNQVNKKGVYILVRTSNPGANDFQMLKLADGRYMYQHVANKVVEWSKDRPGVGAVVGATSLTELSDILQVFAGKNIPVLVPGVQTQGGSAKEVADIARNVGFDLKLLRINSSSGITHPWYKNPGDKIPPLDECVSMSIDSLKDLNLQVGSII